MRFLLFTGKGGVGKTTVAAATAVRCAELGHRTLLMSTDPAHSLGDALAREVGPNETPVTDRLDAIEVDVNEEIRRNWGPIQRFIQQFLKHRGFDGVIAEELAVFPGMEEVFSLLRLKEYYVRGHYDVVIIDCAPTGETLRLLSVPDIANWYMEKLFHIERTVFKAARPIAKYFVDAPLPDDEVFDSAEGLYRNLIGMKELLSDPEVSSVRMVVNPEKMVIKESQRAYTFLNLFGFSCDAVVVNRLIPDRVSDSFYARWKEIQEEYLRQIQESFPLPLLRSFLWDREVVGLGPLSEMARQIYGQEDPSAVLHQERPIEMRETPEGYEVLLRLPFASREVVDLWVKGEELVVKFKNHKRNIFLPRALARAKLAGARLSDGVLRVRFEKAEESDGAKG